jgi:WD40-like Beta Propeller Repeat
VQVTSIGGPPCSNPRWSPDGNTILFNSRREGSLDLYLLRLDTRELDRLTDEPTDELVPRWSRDGQWIYFGSDRTGQLEVWRMPAGGGPPVQITQQGGTAATESPDRRFLYYAKPAKPTSPMSVSPPSIWRVPWGGGEETPVVSGLSFHANFVVADKGLYFVTGGQGSPNASIDFVEYGSGRRTTLVHLGKPAWYGAALSPDQRSMLFSTIENFGSNLMLVDTFGESTGNAEKRAK